LAAQRRLVTILEVPKELSLEWERWKLVD